VAYLVGREEPDFQADLSWAAKPSAIRISEQQKASTTRGGGRKVVASGGEHGVDGVAAGMGKVVASHAVMFFEVAE